MLYEMKYEFMVNVKFCGRKSFITWGEEFVYL